MFPASVVARVKSHLGKFSDASECWEWPMSRTRAGYGQLSYRVNGDQTLAYAHRVAFVIAFGAIPDGHHVCHRCDNPACFNPAHLFSGTPKDNMGDMAAKGRSKAGRTFPVGEGHWSKSRPLRGSANGHSKLTEADVLAILQSPLRNVRLAERFGVSQTTVSYIRKGKVWPHITQAYLQDRQRQSHSK